MTPGDEVILTRNPQPKQRPGPGLGKGMITIIDPDFDAPLEDMKEYMGWTCSWTPTTPRQEEANATGQRSSNNAWKESKNFHSASLGGVAVSRGSSEVFTVSDMDIIPESSGVSFQFCESPQFSSSSPIHILSPFSSR
jgi:hypothetical protein